MKIRFPAVAGGFYPATAPQLMREVDALLLGAGDSPQTAAPKALIVPHAGYVYSGPIAAVAYAALRPWRDAYRRVVLLGPSHRVAVRGAALPSSEAFATPLGSVAIDREGVDLLRRLPQISIDDAAHAFEHSIEVQLPFLQRVLDSFMLLPIAVGDARADEVAEILEQVWGGPETLIVVSSDLSHYLSYDDARRTDRHTADEVLALAAPIRHHEACGATPINGLLIAARSHDLAPHLLDLRNSGDTAGDRTRVVGYASFIFTTEHDHEHARRESCPSS